MGLKLRESVALSTWLTLGKTLHNLSEQLKNITNFSVNKTININVRLLTLSKFQGIEIFLLKILLMPVSLNQIFR